MIGSILQNPIYAGAYVYGRYEERLGLVKGQLRRRCKGKRPLEAWPICLRDHHPAYISWDEFMANQKKLHENRTSRNALDHGGAAREGRPCSRGACCVVGAATG